MRKLLLFLVCFAGYAAQSHSQDELSQCESAIAYNLTEIKSNYASKLAVWESIDRETFERRKKDQSLGVTVYGIPIDYSYEQFDEERTRLRQSFALQQDIQFSVNSRWQAVDPGSTDRYIACVDKITQKKFIASVVSATRDTVLIRVKKNENPGQLNADKVIVVSTTGGTPSRKKVTLAGTASTTLSFKRTPGAAFDTVLVLATPQGTDIDSASFALPRYTNIQNRPVEVVKKSQERDCRHTATGPAQGTMDVSASINERLIPGTQTLDFRELDPARCPGGSVSSVFYNVNERRIDMQGSCASARGECQYPVMMWFTVKAVRDFYVDVDVAQNLQTLLRNPAVLK